MISGALMGGGGGRDEQPAPVQEQQALQPVQYNQQQQQGPGGPCQIQMKQFLECAQSQHDITLCQGFNEALRECKMSYGMSV
jgi:ubiquitin carboxyl-terminal hydrolase 6/32